MRSSASRSGAPEPRIEIMLPSARTRSSCMPSSTSPARMRVRSSRDSCCRDSGTKSGGRPRACSRVKPNVRSAAAFQKVTTPSRSVV